MLVERDRGKRQIYLSQGAYLQKVLARFQMENGKKCSTPTDAKIKLHNRTEKETSVHKKLYQEAVGNLDKYLPESLQKYYQMQLENIGITAPITTSMQQDDGLPTHKVAYLYPREVVNYFVTHGGTLKLSVKPTGTYCWEPSVDLQQEAPLEINLEIDEYLNEMDSVYISEDSNEEDGFNSDTNIEYTSTFQLFYLVLVL
ncbi:hypothetical protein HOY82DRAFT_598788 [Tuber indicum]|nr:hypothetical protein HOY82DRAFT_598788 [Tuber indicum]